MEDKDISITLKGNVWNVILNALAGRPYGEVASVITDIQRQASMQIDIPQAATEDGQGAA